MRYTVSDTQLAVPLYLDVRRRENANQERSVRSATCGFAAQLCSFAIWFLPLYVIKQTIILKMLSYLNKVFCSSLHEGHHSFKVSITKSWIDHFTQPSMILAIRCE